MNSRDNVYYEQEQRPSSQNRQFFIVETLPVVFRKVPFLRKVSKAVWAGRLIIIVFSEWKPALLEAASRLKVVKIQRKVMVKQFFIVYSLIVSL